MSQPKHHSIWNNFNNTNLIRYVLLFILGWAIVQIVAYFSSVIIIFIFAAIFAFLLSFPVQWAARIVPRGIAVISVFFTHFINFSCDRGHNWNCNFFTDTAASRSGTTIIGGARSLLSIG